jgi:hypothetical protein
MPRAKRSISSGGFLLRQQHLPVQGLVAHVEPIGHDVHRGLGWRILVYGIVSDERALFTTLRVPTLQRLVEAEKEGSYGVFHDGDLHIPRAHAVVHALARAS